jgi:hypothetical protein
MVTQNDNGLVRVTVTLEPVDVDLLDRLAALEGLNRSSELRSLLSQLRPMLRQTVEAFETALKARDMLSESARASTLRHINSLLPEAQRVADSYLGFLARLEGEAAVASSRAAEDPRPSNHGGHTPTPPPTDDLA